MISNKTSWKNSDNEIEILYELTKLYSNTGLKLISKKTTLYLLVFSFYFLLKKQWQTPQYFRTNS